MKEIKDLFKKGEQEITKSLLKWKLSKEGKTGPVDEKILERAAENLIDQTHEVLKRRSKNILKELKEAGRELKNSAKD